ncbi:60S ribosomal protein L22, putative [Leishmania donovani]|uniref:60S ribosomal protein L22, putative n=1 Tax=Leishmania donovani TaxID=5661 RepID=E9BUH2_LEIDO|nr:60S ribosomal protein L22, putative [Leishmania donovani]CBZ38901.1 60S ribosomal protein L22, putative [Leishmania donovani]
MVLGMRLLPFDYPLPPLRVCPSLPFLNPFHHNVTRVHFSTLTTSARALRGHTLHGFISLSHKDGRRSR